MNILGITGSIGWDGNISFTKESNFTLGDMWVHGSGATLVVDGALLASMCEERFTRIKYDGNYPENVITNILKENNLNNDDIDLVVYTGNCCVISSELKRLGYLKERLEERFPNAEIEFISHHLAHQSATFLTSKFTEANVFTFDGAGDEVLVGDEWKVVNSMFSIGDYKNKTLTEISSTYCFDCTNSFGAFYNFMSQIIYDWKMDIKVRILSDHAIRESYPGKIMGLSSYGDEAMAAGTLPEPFVLDSGGIFPVVRETPDWYNCAELNEETYKNTTPEDLAAWTQHRFETYLLLFLDNIPHELKKDNLCLGGGCALNILTNSKIIEQGIYKNVHVNTAPNDDGLHFGAALYGAWNRETSISLPDDIGYLGIPYTDEDIESALSDFSFVKFSSGNNFLELCQWVVGDLKENKVVAWFQDKSEFGPRALGNRSILVNPIIDNKDHLNNNIKYRESWRPYAPIVLSEEVQSWFDLPIENSPHMLFNATVLKSKRKQLPSITHIDNSARVQTVSISDNFKLYSLLQEFFKSTGVPVLLNTSFNVGGEPIVESPQDAINTFIKSNIDILVMENYYCWK